MTNSYHTAEFVIGDITPETPLQCALRDIVHDVRSRIADALDNPETNLLAIHPRVVISMVVTNILVNLVDRSLNPHLDISTRLDMIHGIVDEVSVLSLKLFTAMEAAKADSKTAH